MQHESQSALPAADAESAAHSERCAEFLRDRIADDGGSIAFAEFMHHALYAPGLGYYSAGTTKFGADGDFVTAPEVSSLFGRVLARQVAAVLDSVERGGQVPDDKPGEERVPNAETGGGVGEHDGQGPAPIAEPGAGKNEVQASIIEFGAGSGKLTADVLSALEALDTLPQRYDIVEVSPDLCERQERLLRESVPDLVDRVNWLSRPPDEHCGVVIANEVLDALPVERFLRCDDGIRQLRVGVDNGGFKFVEADAPEPLIDAVEAIERDLGERLPAGYVSEVSLATPGWIADIAGSLSVGAVFLFDYGLSRREYYAKDRSGGWLRCHFHHRAHSEPLINVGIQDLTAWVDFSAVAGAAVDSGLTIGGYTSQSQFLIGAGLDRELENLADMPLRSQLEISSQIKMLTLPGEMGENVKCMALNRGIISPVSQASSLDAFSASDRTHTL